MAGIEPAGVAGQTPLATAHLSIPACRSVAVPSPLQLHWSLFFWEVGGRSHRHEEFSQALFLRRIFWRRGADSDHLAAAKSSRWMGGRGFGRRDGSDRGVCPAFSDARDHHVCLFFPDHTPRQLLFLVLAVAFGFRDFNSVWRYGARRAFGRVAHGDGISALVGVGHHIVSFPLCFTPAQTSARASRGANHPLAWATGGLRCPASARGIYQQGGRSHPRQDFRPRHPQPDAARTADSRSRALEDGEALAGEVISQTVSCETVGGILTDCLLLHGLAVSLFASACFRRRVQILA